jgi:hypothetical protein
MRVGWIAAALTAAAVACAPVRAQAPQVEGRPEVGAPSGGGETLAASAAPGGASAAVATAGGPVPAMERPAGSERSIGGASAFTAPVPPPLPVAAVPFLPTPAPELPLHREPLGCYPGLMTADGLDAVLAEQLGPILGFDNVHIVAMGGDRYVWFMHDAFVDYPGTAGNLKEGTYLHNWVLEQQGECLTFVHRLDGFTPAVFEPGVGRITPQRFFWPLGGEVLDGTLWVFWAEMQGTPEPPPVGDGLSRHPVATWLAGYDAVTLERQYFERAPNSGVYPQYGFAVASDERYSYLFGNANMLNLALTGGFFGGPHPSVHMYVARVPRGQLYVPPEYWDGSGWSPSQLDAVPFSSRFWAENTMQPRYLDGEWIAVTKKDGFWGSEVVIDAANRPEGPWRTVEQGAYEPRFGQAIQNSYQPVLAPWLDADGSPIVIISQNGQDWPMAVDNPPWYRPSVFTVDSPD